MTTKVVFDIESAQAAILTSDAWTVGDFEVCVPELAGLVAYEPSLRAGDEIVLRCPELRVMIPAVITSFNMAAGRVRVIA